MPVSSTIRKQVLQGKFSNHVCAIFYSSKRVAFLMAFLDCGTRVKARDPSQPQPRAGNQTPSPPCLRSISAASTSARASALKRSPLSAGRSSTANRRQPKEKKRNTDGRFTYVPNRSPSPGPENVRPTSVQVYLDWGVQKGNEWRGGGRYPDQSPSPTTWTCKGAWRAGTELIVGAGSLLLKKLSGHVCAIILCRFVLAFINRVKEASGINLMGMKRGWRWGMGDGAEIYKRE